MDAQATARNVLTWATDPAGALPQGPLWDVAELASPSPEACAAAAELARTTAARIGAGSPPFGGDSRIGPGVILLAAAAGGRSQAGPAGRLVAVDQMVMSRRPGFDWAELVVRHGLLSALLPAFPVPAALATAAPDAAGPDRDQEPLIESLLRASPLTCVLRRPALRKLAAQATGAEIATAAALLGRPRGRAVLAASLAGWSPDAAVLKWRTELMARLGPEHQELVLDSYTLARDRHGAEWDDRIGWARRQLGVPGPSDPLAIATLRYWAPLAIIESRGISLAAVRPLLSGHRLAIELVRRYRFDQAGAA